MKQALLIFGLVLTAQFVFGQSSYEALSQSFLQSLKANESTSAAIKQYADIELESLRDSLTTDDEKIAFWGNTYNGFVQYFLSKNPALYSNRDDFFASKAIQVGNCKMSLNDIKHGILRKQKIQKKKGSKRKYTPKWLKKIRVIDVDGRIHFVLSDGAKSSPQISVLQSNRLENQLELSTELYLRPLTMVNEDVILTSPFFLRYPDDFGGEIGVKNYLKEKNFIQSLDQTIDEAPFNWTLILGNYIDL